MPTFWIGQREIGEKNTPCCSADSSANHDGDLGRAKRLVELAKGSGADAAKFQNFRAPEIVSKRGFETIGIRQAHQAAWRKSVFQVYAEATIPWEWTPILKDHCEKMGIE